MSTVPHSSTRPNSESSKWFFGSRGTIWFARKLGTTRTAA